MKTAQELRVGNVFLVDGQPMVVVRSEFNKSGRGASVVKLKYKSLLTGAMKEEVYKADVKFEVAVLDRKPCTYGYFADPMYVFMDAEFNQYEVGKDTMGTALYYLEEGMPVEVVFYENNPISVDMEATVVCEIKYTEPAVRGDTSGKVTKIAVLKGTDHEIQVPAFCSTGDKIEIDTRTDEYRRRL